MQSLLTNYIPENNMQGKYFPENNIQGKYFNSISCKPVNCSANYSITMNNSIG